MRVSEIVDGQKLGPPTQEAWPGAAGVASSAIHLGASVWAGVELVLETAFDGLTQARRRHSSATATADAAACRTSRWVGVGTTHWVLGLSVGLMYTVVPFTW